MTDSQKFSPNCSLCVSLVFCCVFAAQAHAQDTVTGAFEGTVSHSQTQSRVPSALVEIINQASGIVIKRRTDAQGRFYQGRLPPGIYLIRVTAPGFRTAEKEQLLITTAPNQVIPIPVTLEPESAASPAVAVPPSTLPPTQSPTGVVATPTPPTPTGSAAGGTASGAPQLLVRGRDFIAEMYASEGRRGGAFTDEEISTLPLGATTLTRTFDELALLLPGVAPPPQTSGGIAGPGIGAGVGSAGQFTTNGLRSRANNFTVDGSDNNDEDIGVRRQGFLAFVSQPVESVKEYQVITLLAPAQFGRNIGAQVNAVSKSGGNGTHGTVFGFFNSSQLNARNRFDTAHGTAVTPLRSNNQDVLIETRDNSGRLIDRRPLTVRNQSGGEDSFTLGHGGLAFGGPLKLDRMFYFIAGEGQVMNATREESFVVPTVEQRGAFRTGATGLFRDPFTGAPMSAISTTRGGSLIFNFFPFPNNPNGTYESNTFTQVLPASSQGKVLAGKFDGNFKVRQRQQSVTARYNFTDDWRNIPATGEAIFSTLRPRVRTQNLSIIFNGEVSHPDSAEPVFNQLRLSYGRTRLKFEEERDRTFLLPSSRLPQIPFLLNAPAMINITQPSVPGTPNNGPVIFSSDSQVSTVDNGLGILGQIHIAGFSPLGVDVFNFPQRRVNNTYQIADDLTLRIGDHTLTLGTDNRRTELNSDLPRNSRPLATFNGAPRLIFEGGAFRFPTSADPNSIIRPEDLAAVGAVSNFFFTLNTSRNDANINLSFHQLSFYGQDAWRPRANLVLSYGLRYEYNTPVREANQLIEDTFSNPALNLAPGLRRFIDGRTRIYEPDRNNIAPRFGIAYAAPNLFGRRRGTVFRAGYGLFYDQILGAVASQSRNVYSSFLTLNFGGFGASFEDNVLTFFNPAATSLGVGDRFLPLQVPGTLNRFNSSLPLDRFIQFLNASFPSALGATLPARRLAMPMAQHYSFTFEQQLSANLMVSAAYAGTRGSGLLRFTTPNLGPASFVTPTSLLVRPNLIFDEEIDFPVFIGRVNSPPRPISGIGAINLFETTANSRYDSLQIHARGRFGRMWQLQAAYAFSKATDDVSDVFDLAGAFRLPQNSLTFAGEWGPANFDTRHRLSYNFILGLSDFRDRHLAFRFLFSRLKIAGTGQFHTGQPFTVNSTIDVNMDGNLTDRLNTTDGIVMTGERRQPLRLIVDNPFILLAPFGQDGRIGRNTFRAGNFLELDLMVSKSFPISAEQSVIIRTDVFNFLNRANFGVPVRLLEAPGFGHATSTVTPGRRFQISLKYLF